MRAPILAVIALLAASCDEDFPPDNFTPEAVAGVKKRALKLVLQEQWDIDEAWEEAWAGEEPPPPDVTDALDARQLANVDEARDIDRDDLSAADQLTLDIYLERYGILERTMPCDRAANMLRPPSAARRLDAPAPAYRRATMRARALDDDDRPGTTPECYRAYIRAHTTTDLTPEAIHQIGLDELAVVEAEIVALGTRLYGVSTLAEIRDHLQNDPAQRFASLDDIMASTQALVDQATLASAPVFASLPTHPMHLVPSGGGSAAYGGPWKDRPVGEYYVASEPVEAQRRYPLPSVTVHEGIPGHHLERARSFERLDLPWMRRTGADTIYVEGWGFYTEYLADDLGFYADDAARLGALSNRALRASRLVVDTGMHALGWDRARSIEFLTAHTLETPEYVAIQVNRYFYWPGQALAYMLGAREILRLRDKAETTLGDRYSLRDFHERFLADGSLPVELLTSRMEAWIDEQARR
jgi:uncharacterized protein (DUF885 family)